MVAAVVQAMLSLNDNMRFDLVTIFPDFFAGPLDHGILRRARETGIVEVNVQDLRVFTKDRHRTVDDRPFGGGEGMVLKPEPLFEAVESLLDPPAPSSVSAAPPAPTDSLTGSLTNAPPRVPAGTAVILLSASGNLFRQPDAERL